MRRHPFTRASGVAGTPGDWVVCGALFAEEDGDLVAEFAVLVAEGVVVGE